MEVRIQKDDGFFPAWRHAKVPASSTVLAFAVRSPDFLYLDIVYSLNRVSYLRLVCLFVYFEAVRPLLIREVHTLLSNQRPNYDIIVVHINTISILRCLLLLQDGQQRLLGKQHFPVTTDIAGIKLAHRHYPDFR